MNASSSCIFCALVALAACHAPAATPAPDDAGAPQPSAPIVPVAAAPSATPAPRPPPPVLACRRDEDCAVAQVDVRGPTACCVGCGTTPGTRAWYADLMLFCGAHPPVDCPTLACPKGGTRAICRDGECRSSSLALDGGPDIVTSESKCTPVLVCDTWVGCASVEGDFQNGWYLAEPLSTTFGAIPKGTAATLERDACIPHVPGKCAGARLAPRSVTCPPRSVPPLVAPPKPCVLTGTACRIP